MQSFTEQLASFVASAQEMDVPAGALRAAKLAIIDTVAVGVAGVNEPVSQLAQQWARDIGAAPRTTIWGTNLCTSMAEAAFANGVSSHALDFDDALPSMRGHASAVIAPCVLAVAENIGASGRNALHAFIVGVEVAGAMGEVVGNNHYNRGWHATSTLGVLAAAAAASRLFELDVNKTRIALGLAASQAAGLTVNFGTMSKPLHVGSAARSGVLAAWLAHKGANANMNILDGERSFLDVYASEHLTREELQPHIDTLGRPWQILKPGLSVKRWPCCFANYRAIAGLRELAGPEGLVAKDIEEIAVGFLPGSDRALIHTHPQTGLEAKFSIEYVLAAMAIDGDLSVSTFTDEMVSRPEVAWLMTKIRRYSIPSEREYSGSADDGFTDVTLRVGGIESTIRIDYVLGSSKRALAENDFREKILGCVEPTLGITSAEPILEAGLALDQLETLESFLEPLRSPGRSGVR